MSLDGKVAIIDIDGRFGSAMLALGRYSGPGPHPGERMSVDPGAVHGPDHRAIASRRIAYATVAKIGRPVLVLVERATPRQAGRSADPASSAASAEDVLAADRRRYSTSAVSYGRHAPRLLPYWAEPAYYPAP